MAVVFTLFGEKNPLRVTSCTIEGMATIEFLDAPGHPFEFPLLDLDIIPNQTS